MSVSVGRFRDVVDIKKDTSNDTDEQQEYTGLPFIAAVPAQVEHVGGHEKGQDTFIKYEVTCHYMEGITETMEVDVKEGPFTDETLNIQEVETVRKRGRPVFLVLHCLKVT